MKCSSALLLLGFVVSCCSAAYIKVGSEYVYAYSTNVHAGSHDYVSFGSSFNITGTVRLQKSDSTLIKVKLEDLKYSSYNGESDFYPAPEVTSRAYQELNPLTEPFHVKLNGNNLAESIVLSESIPEWARNIQRGLATSLQLDTQKISGTESNVDVTEKTVTGECPTNYQIVKTEGGYKFSKLRSHAKCDNRPVQIRKPGIHSYKCQDDTTRNVLNSSSYANYDLENFNGELALKRVSAGSSLIFQAFGNKGHNQFSWSNSVFDLTEVKTSGFSPIPAPSQAKTYDNLRYVFESSYTEEDDLQKAHAYYPHQKEASTDEAFLKKTSDRLYDSIQALASSLETTEVYEDTTKFHSVTPLALMPFISVLPYTHLKSLYARVKAGEKKVELHIFLDALAISGTGPSALLIKDIVENTKEDGIIGRLVAAFPNYVRNPTEKLLKELESMIKPDLPKHKLRVIEFAYASLIHRTCGCKTKNLCSASGLLEKYVKYFSDKYDNAENFEEKTVGILGLRNIGLGGAKDKLLAIVKDKTVERSVRVQAIAAIKTYSREEVHEALLPIFYDRALHHEIRTTAATVILNVHYDEVIAQQMVFYMWTEPCKYVKNFLYTVLEGISATTNPCLTKSGAHAKVALAMYPKWKLDRFLSGHYNRDYVDREHGFGAVNVVSVQKSGDSVLPVTLYVSFGGHIAGHLSYPVSAFVRLEGLGKALADRIMSMTTGQISFDEVKKVFTDIGVKERSATPLRVELGLLLHGRVVAYHAADAKTITTVPQLLKKLQEMKTSYDVEGSRMAMLGGVNVEYPTEFGTPVSVLASAYSIAAAKVKTTREKTGSVMSQTSDYRLQAHVFGMAQVSNFLPAFGSVHAVSAYRGLRIRIPRHFNLGLDVKQLSLTFGVETPTKEDPIIIMAHATAATSVYSDNDKKAEVIERLKSSCPTCEPVAVISKGAEHRGTRQIGVTGTDVSKFAIFQGVKRGAKFFDCEKPHTRYQTIKKVAKYFGEQDKNAGKLGVVRALLGVQQMVDSIFLSPPTATCGVKAYYYQDKDAKSVFEKVEGQVRVKYTPDPNKKLGTKVQFKGSVNFKHGGSEPQGRLVEVTGQVHLNGFDKRDVKLRFLAKDEKTGKNGVLCVEAATQMKKSNDFLDFEGENEPTFERKITANWGPEPAGKDACPTTDAYIKATRKARRSQEQITEAGSNVWPYKNCREQKGSAHYPGSTTPWTYECFEAAIDQTNLRESNISIEYQVDVEARNRWKKPMVLAAAFLLPYWDTDSSAVAAHVHSTHSDASHGAQYVKGSVEIDVSARKENPTLDIHFHGSQGDEHFHNVDVAALPGPLKIKPVFSRFSPYTMTAFKSGIFGYCIGTPATVLTFDNATYHADLSECPTLLAADCDDKPRYAVLLRKLAADKVGVTIHFGDHKIELNDVDTATVDGKAIPVTDSVYTDEDEEKLFKFVKVAPEATIILAEKLSVYVGYTGNAVSVTAGSRYRGTACGLCGNFNSNKNDDFVGPDATCKNLTPNDMMKAYIAREGNCARVGSPCPSA
jgi:hypothetical protein